ncbi:MAG: hypothetical protein ACTHNG_00555, partial [Ginsengibacter sp.]
MEKSNNHAPAAQAFSLVAGVANTQVITNLVTGNVFEMLGNGPKSLEEIAEGCNLNKRVLGRTLRYAAFIGLVEIEGNTY